MKNLKVITSGRMEDLSARLGKNLKSMSTPVFSKTMIITQGAAMNSWLITTLTQTNAIFANYAFQNQDGFMGKVYELLTGEKYANNRDVIKFGVYRLIGTEAFKK
ncbi:MAG: exodeoxyribonuclease V subunit gamma, partial [Bacteroidota bacterium]